MKQTARRAGVAVLGAMLAFGLPALATGQEAPSLDLGDTISVEEDSADTITLSSFTLAEAGYVVVHEDSDGAPGAVIGSSEYLEAGAHTDVEVTLDRDLEADEVIWPMLHTEGSDNETYDGIEPDPPVIDETAGNPDANNVITFPVTVQIGDGEATPEATTEATPESTPATEGTPGAGEPEAEGTPGAASTGNAGLVGGNTLPLGLGMLFVLMTLGAVATARAVTSR